MSNAIIKFWPNNPLSTLAIIIHNAQKFSFTLARLSVRVLFRVWPTTEQTKKKLFCYYIINCIVKEHFEGKEGIVLE